MNGFCTNACQLWAGNKMRIRTSPLVGAGSNRKCKLSRWCLMFRSFIFDSYLLHPTFSITGPQFQTIPYLKHFFLIKPNSILFPKSQTTLLLIFFSFPFRLKNDIFSAQAPTLSNFISPISIPKYTYSC